jgi:hypothetical protein
MPSTTTFITFHFHDWDLNINIPNTWSVSQCRRYHLDIEVTASSVTECILPRRDIVPLFHH